MSSAALAAFLLFAAFFEIIAEYHSTPLWHVSIMDEMSRVILGDPLIFVGGLIGAALVFFFASLAIRAVGTAAGEMVQEVREQFADGKIMAGEKEPEYGRCVDIATRSALKQMVVPALLPILVPVVFGLLYKYVLPDDILLGGKIAPYAVGGLIMVATIVGILMAGIVKNASMTHAFVNIHQTKTKLPTPMCTTFLLSMLGSFFSTMRLTTSAAMISP